ncbi:MAG: hypothetical protein N3A38_05670 [Planctomycetota bacterium]|nr:hypothetical protein [Planctomycetota bacterium]
MRLGDRMAGAAAVSTRGTAGAADGGRSENPEVRFEEGRLMGASRIFAAAVTAVALGMCAGTAAGGGEDPSMASGGRLPPPPVPVIDAKILKGDWIVEHIAFTLGHTGQPVGGPARWAVGGVLPVACRPADQAGKIYTGDRDSDVRLYFSDQRRRFWLLEKGEVWPIAGCDDLGEEDGPGQCARFIYSGVYGGGHSGMVASGSTVYVADNGRLRRIQRQSDGSWMVTTVAGLGNGPQGTLAGLKGLGKGLAIDPAGNIYFTLGGGLVRADPEGKLTTVITAAKATADMAEIYAKKWPGVKPPAVALGQGEGVSLIWHKDGSIYGGGRTWPSTWKVTADGRFVPLVDYAPKDKMLSARWGPGDPACYAPHCSMGWGVTPEGYVWHQNEIPFAMSRYEFDRNQVSVLDADFTWKVLPADHKGFFKQPEGIRLIPDYGMGEGDAPGPFHTRSMWVRLRPAGSK